MIDQNRREYLDEKDLQRAFEDFNNSRVMWTVRGYVYNDESSMRGQLVWWNKLVMTRYKTSELFEVAARQYAESNRYSLTIQDRTKGEQVAQVISQFVNGGTAHQHKVFAATLANDHRTLQQSATALCRKFLETMAENHKNGHYDLRNQQAGEFALAAVRATEDIPLPLI